MKMPRFVCGLLMCLCGGANAAVTVTFAEVGASVQATAVGTLNTTSAVSSSTSAAISLIEYVSASSYAYIVGQGGGGSATVFTVPFNTSQPLNTAAVSATPDTNTGGPVGVNASGAIVVLYAPVGYQTGNPINSSSTWNNTTFADLGLTPGSYVFAYGSGPSADSITFVIPGGGAGSSAQPVPLMPIWLTALMSTILLLLGIKRLRSTRVSR